MVQKYRSISTRKYKNSPPRYFYGSGETITALFNPLHRKHAVSRSEALAVSAEDNNRCL
jgi:hypothetical protein